MKTLLRCVFAGLILLGVASQMHRSQRSNGDAQPLAALADRLRQLDIRPEADLATDALTGHAAACDMPLRAVLLRNDGANEAVETAVRTRVKELCARFPLYRR